MNADRRPAHLPRYGRPSSRVAAEVRQMLLDIADRLERNRPDDPLTPTGRLAVIQATTMAPPLAARLREQAPEITALITRRAYAARLREITDPDEPAPPADLPETTHWTEDRTATVPQLLERAAADFAQGEAHRGRARRTDGDS